MILFIEQYDGTRQHYIVNALHDLAPIYIAFPQTQDIAMQSSTLKEAVQNVADYIASHNLDAWVEDPKLSKSLRHKAMALGLALGATVPTQSSVSSVMSPSVQIQQAHVASPEDKFLWNIAQIESAGGTNTKHKMIMSGPQKGEIAIGKYGLLRPTIEEVLTRMHMDGKIKPEHRIMAGMSRDEMDKYLQKKPHVEKDLAQYLARHVLARHGNNEHKAAYSWLNGHNLSSSRITDKHLKQSDYVQKYKIANQMNPLHSATRIIASNTMQKALVADEGYTERLKAWRNKRQEHTNKPLPRDHSFVPDPGRKREESLDEKDQKPISSYDKLRQQIKKLNDGNS